MRRLSSLLSPALKDLGIFQRTREAQVRSLWPGVVGARLATECWPETLRGGTLVVRASSAALSHQLRLEAPVLLARLNEKLGDSVVRDLRLRVGVPY